MLIVSLQFKSNTTFFPPHLNPYLSLFSHSRNSGSQEYQHIYSSALCFSKQNKFRFLTPVTLIILKTKEYNSNFLILSSAKCILWTYFPS